MPTTVREDAVDSRHTIKGLQGLLCPPAEASQTAAACDLTVIFTLALLQKWLLGLCPAHHSGTDCGNEEEEGIIEDHRNEAEGKKQGEVGLAKVLPLRGCEGAMSVHLLHRKLRCALRMNPGKHAV